MSATKTLLVLSSNSLLSVRLSAFDGLEKIHIELGGKAGDTLIR